MIAFEVSQHIEECIKIISTAISRLGPHRSFVAQYNDSEMLTSKTAYSCISAWKDNHFSMLLTQNLEALENSYGTVSINIVDLY